MKFLLSAVLLFIVNSVKIDDEFQNTFKVKVLEKGDDAKHRYPNKGDNVQVHYTGWTLDGKKFDSSRDRSGNFDFKVGVQQVIPCWDQVIARLTKGDKVEVICPSALAYGERGAGSIIPPNSDLKFEIEMIDFGAKGSDL